MQLISRRGKSFNETFPEVLDAVAAYLPAATVVDGEIVRWNEGRLDFGALQQRNRAARHARHLARTEPCHLVLFDVVEARGRDLGGEPLARRRTALDELFAAVPGESLLTQSMQTADVGLARTWFDALVDVGVEGLVIKGASEPYRPERRDWLKYKRKTTTEAIIGGVTGSLQRPAELILGRHDGQTGELRMVGRSTTLHPPTRDTIAADLRPAGDEHPWPQQLPPGWHSREPTPYIRVLPQVVVEVSAEVAVADGRWRHPVRVIRLRSDLEAGDVPTDLHIDA